MRAIWTGHLTFGLVSIPVGLHSALEAAERVSFRQLHRKDMAPIRYKKFCSAEDVEVPNEEIVKGYEVEKGRFAVVEEEELEQVQAELGEDERILDVLEFVELGQLNPLLFEKPYYVAPQRGGQKAYGVLSAALRETRHAGIARFQMRSRPLLGALLPGEDVLALEVLRPVDELRDPGKLALPEEKARPAELEMARALIEKMSGTWDPAAHPNRYRAALEKLLEGRKTVAVGEPPRAAEPSGKVVDLMEALRKSLGEAKPKPTKRPAAARRKSSGRRGAA